MRPVETAARSPRKPCGPRRRVASGRSRRAIRRRRRVPPASCRLGAKRAVRRAAHRRRAGEALLVQRLARVGYAAGTRSRRRSTRRRSAAAGRDAPADRRHLERARSTTRAALIRARPCDAKSELNRPGPGGSLTVCRPRLPTSCAAPSSTSSSTRGHTRGPVVEPDPARRQLCCSRTRGWCRSSPTSSATRRRRTRARRRCRSACARAASTTTSTTSAARTGTSRSSRCSATSASATTSRPTRSRWAWELYTEVLGLDPDRLWVTVHDDRRRGRGDLA